MANQLNNDLSGSINQYVSPTLLATNQFELLVNCSQQMLGALSNRDGAVLLDTIAGSGHIQGLHAFTKDDDTQGLHAVFDGDFYLFDETTGEFGTAQDTGVVSPTSRVEFADYIGRNYFIGSEDNEYLSYITASGTHTLVKIAQGTASASSTGSTLVASTPIFAQGMVGMTVFNTTDSQTRTITGFTSATTVTVDSAINDTWDNDSIELRMPGKFLAVAGPYMIVAGGSRRAYWSQIESDAFDVTTDYATTSAPHTGVGSMGNGRPFLLFTRNTYLVVDPISGDTDEVRGFGCVSHRTIKTVRGRTIWLSNDGFYMLAANQAFPEEISLLIRNDTTEEAIMQKLLAGNMVVSAAGAYKDRYFCAVRDLTGPVKGETLEDCILEFNVAQMSWKVHTYTRGGLASVMTNFLNEDFEEGLYAGGLGDGAVYKIENTVESQDDNSTGSPADFVAIAITPHRVFGDSESVEAKDISRLFFRYKAENNIKVKYSVDGGAYGNEFELPASSAMMTWNYTNKRLTNLKSISLRFEFIGSFILYEYGFDVYSDRNTGTKPV